MGRDLAHFTAGLSAVFTHYAAALKRGRPFVFTYHHNDASAYVPLVVAVLDAGLDCTAVLPVAAEMGASLHISGTGSSVLDSVFVCRHDEQPRAGDIPEDLAHDIADMRAAGVRVTQGDAWCLGAGHAAKAAMNALRPTWNPTDVLDARMHRAAAALRAITDQVQLRRLAAGLVEAPQDAAEEPSIATAV